MRYALSLFLVIFAVACGAKNPPPLTLEEIPEALKKSFATARLQPKKNAEAVAGLVKDKQYAVASIQLQGLLQADGLSEEQRNVTSAALTTLNAVLSQITGEAEPAQAATSDSVPPPPKVEVSEQEVETAKAVRQHYIRTK